MKVKRPAVILFTLALMIVGLGVFTNVVPYRQIVEQGRQVAAASAELEALQDENAVLAAQRDALETPVEIERLAREKLGYVRPGEIAYVVLEPPVVPTTAISEPAVEPPPVEDQTLFETMWDFISGADVSG
ncbi:MAG: FtsB family cell division protein [Acidimicrobiia bacterium]